MKKETWIIVANSTIIRIFTVEGAELKEHQTMVHPDSRLHEGDLVSDKPGMNGPRGKTKHIVEQKNTAKKHGISLFAKEVADCIEAARKNGTLEKLYITASPSFLGLIRNEVSPQTQDLIAVEDGKDLTHCKPKEIYEWYTAQKF